MRATPFERDHQVGPGEKRSTADVENQRAGDVTAAARLYAEAARAASSAAERDW